MKTDFSPTARDYAEFRAGFPEVLFERLAGHGVGLTGQRILDLGSGTGSLARGFGRRGALVTALDISEAMLAEARTLAAAEGLAIETRCASADATGLPDRAFDAVSAGQCWHWFDRAAAAREVRRLLRPAGRLAICHFDWIPRPGNVVAATEDLILRHNPAWDMDGGSGLYPAWLGDAADAGFLDLETFSADLTVAYSHEAWCGRIRASAGVGGSLPAEAVSDFDAALAARLARDFPGDPLQIPHRVFALVARAPGERCKVSDDSFY